MTGKYVICNICFGGMGFWDRSGKGEGGGIVVAALTMAAWLTGPEFSVILCSQGRPAAAAAELCS